ncbi:hypothetical protein BV372_10375 [Nostoc sp. T09]|nr:hypothetical protein BV372_10375 [Nostoc sp. T09]
MFHTYEFAAQECKNHSSKNQILKGRSTKVTLITSKTEMLPGKIPPNEAYKQIKALWKKLKWTKQKLRIGEDIPEL